MAGGMGRLIEYGTCQRKHCCGGLRTCRVPCNLTLVIH